MSQNIHIMDKRTTIRLPDKIDQHYNKLVELGLFPNKSEAMRHVLIEATGLMSG